MSRIRACGSGLLALLCLALAACGPFWAAVRENERDFAMRSAQARVEAGDCRAALPSLERAQAHRELGRYAARSTLMKARCLVHLGRAEEGKAHYRLLRDFHPEFQPELVADELREIATPLQQARADAQRSTDLSDLRIPRPRYSASADRSYLSGAVLLRFDLLPGPRVEAIRVLEPTHPLLASFAVEAVAQTELARGVELTGRRAATARIVFESRAQRLSAGAEGR